MPPLADPREPLSDPVKHQRPKRVLCVDDNRDGADALGLLVEALGNQVHVTYGGETALEVATAFRPDLMIVDLVMPGMDGCDLVTRIRRNPAFAKTTIVAITGQKDDDRRALALKAGCDVVLLKPVALADMKAVLSRVVLAPGDGSPEPDRSRPAHFGKERRLPIDVARRIRSERRSKSLTPAETEAAIRDGIIRFQEEYLGWTSEQIDVHLIKDLVVIRIQGALSLAERQIGRSLAPEKGRDLVKQTRKQLLEVGRAMLESTVHEVVGVKVLSMHNDLSTVTGEQMVIFSLTGMPSFEEDHH